MQAGLYVSPASRTTSAKSASDCTKACSLALIGVSAGSVAGTVSPCSAALRKTERMRA